MSGRRGKSPARITQSNVYDGGITGGGDASDVTIVLLTAGAMRLPTLQRDRWTLRSGEESHRGHPDKFWIPPVEERRGLRRGKAARLIFAIEAQDEAGQAVFSGERMWVIVAERIGDLYIGILDNQPATLEPADGVYLCFGAEVPFGPEHVIDIADPPAKHVEWQLGRKPERVWPRD